MYTTFFYNYDDQTKNAAATWIAVGQEDQMFQEIKPLHFPSSLQASSQKDLDQQVQTMLMNNPDCSLATWAQLLVGHSQNPIETDAIGLLSIIAATRAMELMKERIEFNYKKETEAVEQNRAALTEALKHAQGADKFQIQQELQSLKTPTLEFAFNLENLAFWSSWIRAQELQIDELPENGQKIFKGLKTEDVVKSLKNIHHVGGLTTFLSQIEDTYDGHVVGISSKTNEIHRYQMLAQPPEGTSYGVQIGILTDFEKKKPTPKDDDIGALLQQAEDEKKEPSIPEEQHPPERLILVNSVYMLNAFKELTIQADTRLLDPLEWYKERTMKYRANPNPDMAGVRDVLERALQYGCSKLQIAELELKNARRPGGDLAQDICAIVYNRPWIEILGQTKAFDVLGTPVESEAKELFQQFRLFKQVDKGLNPVNSNPEDYDVGSLI